MNSLQKQLKIRSTKNIGEVLQILLQIFENNTKVYNQVLQQINRYNRHGEQKHSATQSTDELVLEDNRIFTAILALIDQITEEEASAYQLKSAIFKRILVVCKSPERELEMRKLFPTQYFKGVEYDISAQPRPADSVNEFDLIVFDNFPSSNANDSHDLLRYYLDQTAPLLLYFGLYLKWLSEEYPEKAYFTNSVFSIHNRLEDMIKYIKYTS